MILGGGATTRAKDRHQVLVFNPLSLGPLLGTAVRPSFSEAWVDPRCDQSSRAFGRGSFLRCGASAHSERAQANEVLHAQLFLCPSLVLVRVRCC